MILLTVSDRVHSWALLLSNCHYQSLYKPGSRITNVDGPNRRHVAYYFTPLHGPEEVVLSLTVLDSTPVTAKTVALHTYLVLSHRRRWMIQGCLYNGTQDFRLYTSRSEELSVQLG